MGAPWSEPWEGQGCPRKVLGFKVLWAIMAYKDLWPLIRVYGLQWIIRTWGFNKGLELEFRVQR